MRSGFRSLATIGIILGTLVLGIPSNIQSAERTVDAEATPSLADFVQYVFAITDLILDHHIDPPTRQEMILAGLKVALAESKIPPMPNLGRRVSDVKTTDDLLVLLNDVWRIEKAAQAPNAKVVPPDFQSQFVRGLLNSVPGDPYLVPTKEARAQAQLQDNRYVGLGIGLGMDDKQKLARIHTVIPGGTAEAGGIHEGDLIEAIDHVDVAPGTPIRKIIERLRGAEGTTVTLRLRAEKSETSRTATFARLPVMIKSVEEVPVPPELAGSGSFQVAHLQIHSVTASTAQELRSWEARLRHSGAQAVILDFRNVGGFRGETDHAALLLADSLLDGALMGKVRTRESTREFRADRDCLFRDWPLAVLVNDRTGGPAEWVAAALQDARRNGSRAILVGRPSRGDNFVKRAIPLPGYDESMVLATGVWERPDAKRQSRDMREPSQSGSGRLSWRVIPDLLVAKTDAAANGGNANRPIAAVKRPKKPAAAVASNAMAIAQNSYAPKQAPVAKAELPDTAPVKMAIAELERLWNASHRATN